MTRNRMILVLAAGALLGLLAGWMRPLPSAAAAADDRLAQWTLPTADALQRSTAEQFAAAQGLRWVGKGSPGGGPGEDAVEWTLQGVLQPEGAILIRVGADPLIKRIPAGGTLPDGSRLAAVERDAAVIERDGCQTRRNLYPRPAQDTTTDRPGCSDPAASQDMPQP